MATIHSLDAPQQWRYLKPHKTSESEIKRPVEKKFDVAISEVSRAAKHLIRNYAENNLRLSV